MKYISSLMCMVFAICAVAPSMSCADVKVTFAYQSTDNFPYQVGNGFDVEKDGPGVAVEMMQVVAQKLNLNLKLIRFPWKRGLLTLKSGKIDGLFNASYDASRSQYGVYPTNGSVIDRRKRSYTNSYSLFRPKSGKLLWDGKNVNTNEFPVFAPRGFSIVNDLEKLGVTVVETSDILQSLKQVNSTRAEGIALFTPSGEAYLRHNPDEFRNIEKHSPPLASKDYYLMLSHQFVKRYPQLAKDIWKQIEKFRESPAFPALIEAYYNNKS